MGMDEAARHMDHQMQLQRPRPYQRDIARHRIVHAHQPRSRKPRLRPLAISAAQSIALRQRHGTAQRHRSQPHAVQPSFVAPMQPKRHPQHRPRPRDPIRPAHAPG